MQIKVNNKVFKMDWEKSTKMATWNEFRAWFRRAIETGYEEDIEGDIIVYPRIEVRIDLSAQMIKGIEYGIIGVDAASEITNGIWRRLWYCEPSEEEFEQFVNVLRLAEHDQKNNLKVNKNV